MAANERVNRRYSSLAKTVRILNIEFQRKQEGFSKMSQNSLRNSYFLLISNCVN